MADLGSEVRTLLVELLRNKGDTATFSDVESLIFSGRLQSIDVVDLVVQLETHFGIDFSEHGFDQSQLDSVSDILQLIADLRA